MHAELHGIEGAWQGRLAIAARPRGGDWIEDEIACWRNAGIDVVISLVTRQESADLNLEREEEVCRAEGIEFIDFPVEDRTFPTSDLEATNLIGKLTALLHCGKNVVAHCRQGVGRAGLIGIGALIYEGTGLAVAIAEVSRARGIPVPETSGQRKWLAQFESLRHPRKIARTG